MQAKSLHIKFIEIDQFNVEIFRNLAQAYEAEFSNLTRKMPNELGIFKVDVIPNKPYVGYLLFNEEKPIGFCVADIENEIKDVAEFYIVPVMRRKKLGYALATMFFNKYPGYWQVRQIAGANDAINFWRSVIKKYTGNQYEESIVQDADWGLVTRQRFQSVVNE